MRKLFLYITLFMAVPMAAQTVYNVEDCRKMALEHNASIKIAKENVKAARSMKKAAFTHFLPDFSATGAYMWNEKTMSLFPHDLMLPVGVKQPDGSLGTGIGANSVPVPNDDGTFRFKRGVNIDLQKNTASSVTSYRIVKTDTGYEAVESGTVESSKSSIVLQPINRK